MPHLASTHLERVRFYAHRLAMRLLADRSFPDEIDAAFVRLIYLTTPYHDVGKLSIPDSILLKPGRLTEDEFETMKRHTTLGAERLAAVLAENPEARFIDAARTIALHHHERFDGTGYPAGLAGEKIPLIARVVAVADVYDALTSVRSYKPALSHVDSAAIIRAGRGSHFDPRVVDAFEADSEAFERHSAAAQHAGVNADPRARWAQLA